MAEYTAHFFVTVRPCSRNILCCFVCILDNEGVVAPHGFRAMIVEVSLELWGNFYISIESVNFGLSY